MGNIIISKCLMLMMFCWQFQRKMTLLHVWTFLVLLPYLTTMFFELEIGKKIGIRFCSRVYARESNFCNHWQINLEFVSFYFIPLHLFRCVLICMYSLYYKIGFFTKRPFIIFRFRMSMFLIFFPQNTLYKKVLTTLHLHLLTQRS